MRLTQGTFSYLPDFDDAQIEAQVRYCLDQGWPVALEHTDEAHPRNVYWEMWGPPLFDQQDPGAVMEMLRACRAVFPERYIRLNAYDSRLGRQTTGLSFIVNRPQPEPGFRLERTEQSGRRVQYGIRSTSGGARAEGGS